MSESNVLTLSEKIAALEAENAELRKYKKMVEFLDDPNIKICIFDDYVESKFTISLWSGNVNDRYSKTLGVGRTLIEDIDADIAKEKEND